MTLPMSLVPRLSKKIGERLRYFQHVPDPAKLKSTIQNSLPPKPVAILLVKLGTWTKLATPIERSQAFLLLRAKPGNEAGYNYSVSLQCTRLTILVHQGGNSSIQIITGVSPFQ